MKYNFFFTILLFLSLALNFSLPAKPQTAQDSLLQKLKRATGRERVDLLNDLAKLESKSSIEKAEQYAEKAYELSSQFNYEFGLARAILNKGLIEYEKVNFERAIEYIQQALAKFNALNNTRYIAKCHHFFGETYFSMGKQWQAITHLHTALSKHDSVKHRLDYANTLRRMGLSYFQLSDYDSSLIYFRRSLTNAYKIGNDDLEARNLNSVGAIYWNLGQYDKSLDNYLTALKIHEKIENHQGVATILNNIGMVYQKLDLIDKANKYYKRAYEVCTKQDMGTFYNFIMGYTYFNLGSAAEYEKNYDQALQYFHKSMKICRAQKGKPGITQNYIHISNIYIAKKKYDRALSCLDSALVIIEGTENQEQKALALLNSGITYFHKSEFNQALNHLKQSFEISRKIKNKDYEEKSLRFISKTYATLKNYTRAYSFYDQYSSLKDSLYNDRMSNEIAELNAKYEIDKKERENEILKKENEVKKSELAQQKIITFATIIVSLLLIALFVLTFRYNRLLKKSYREIQQKRDELEKANSSKDRFFSIIAHDLRSPFNTIVSFVNLISKNADKFSKQEILNLAQDLKSNVDNTRGLLENLLNWSQSQTGNITFKPEKFPVNKVIQNSVREIQNMAQSKSVTININENSDKLIKADYHMIKTVMRNLLTNAIKFSEPDGKISITQTSTNDHVEISITDRGVGMDEKKRANIFQIDKKVSTEGTQGERGSGLGLILCKEFVEMHGGQMHVQSKPGEGSTFSFTIPQSKS